MTDTEIRIAIAEACGLNPVKLPFVPVSIGTKRWFTPEAAEYWRKTYPNGAMARVIPDYLFDLNACHDAIMSQTPEFRLRFEHALQTAARDLGKLVCELPASIHSKVFLNCL